MITSEQFMEFFRDDASLATLSELQREEILLTVFTDQDLTVLRVKSLVAALGGHDLVESKRNAYKVLDVDIVNGVLSYELRESPLPAGFTIGMMVKGFKEWWRLKKSFEPEDIAEFLREFDLPGDPARLCREFGLPWPLVDELSIRVKLQEPVPPQEREKINRLVAEVLEARGVECVVTTLGEDREWKVT